MMGKPPSAYVPLDVNFLRDKDVRSAGPDAELLYIRALTYCKGSFTDGFVPAYDLEIVGVGLKAVEKRVAKLVEVGLWQAVEGGWTVRGWSIWNETSAETTEKKRRAAERQARHRKRDGQYASQDGHALVTRDSDEASQVSNTTKEEEEEEVIASRCDATRDVTPIRPRDDLFDAIVEVCGLNPDEITKSAGSEIGKAKKELLAVDATPNQVRVRANRYRRRYRDATLTPSALAKHWGSLSDIEAPAATNARVNAMTALSKPGYMQ